jgi:hypothetical protein
VRELSLLGCYRASSSMAQLTNLVMLDLQPLQALGPEDEGEGLCTALYCIILPFPFHMCSLLHCAMAPHPLLLPTAHAPGLIGCPAEAMAAAAAAWKVGSLSELRWCGDLAFEAGAAPVDLPRLVALEIE